MDSSGLLRMGRKKFGQREGQNLDKEGPVSYFLTFSLEEA